MLTNDLVLLGRKTIRKEAEALSSFVNQIDESFSKACEMLFQCKGTVLLSGMGKSGLVARKWSSTFSGTGTKSYFINPAEASHGDLGIIRSGDILIALSNSGETEELANVLRHAKEIGIPMIAVTGNPKSSLATQASLLLSVYLSEEACPLGLSPTTSTTLMMALGDAIAVTMMQMRGFTERDFAQLHPGGSLGRRLWLRVNEVMHKGISLPTSSLTDKLDTVLLEMTKKCLGMTVVVENEKIMGVITDGDLRRYFQNHQFNGNATAADLMTKNPKRISSMALALEAREIMEKNSIHQLLIVDENDKLQGVLHIHDLMRKKVM
jgi:arabinose-5-phosphate isomerase